MGVRTYFSCLVRDFWAKASDLNQVEMEKTMDDPREAKGRSLNIVLKCDGHSAG